MSSIYDRKLIAEFVQRGFAYLGLAEHDVAVTAGGLVHLGRSKDEENLGDLQNGTQFRDRRPHVLWPPEGNSGDTRNLFQAQADESLPGLALGAGLDFVEGGSRGGIFLMVVVVVVVVLMVVLMVMRLMVRVVRVDFLDMGHLQKTRQVIRVLQNESTAKTRAQVYIPAYTRS